MSSGVVAVVSLAAIAAKWQITLHKNTISGSTQAATADTDTGTGTATNVSSSPVVQGVELLIHSQPFSETNGGDTARVEQNPLAVGGGGVQRLGGNEVFEVEAPILPAVPARPVMAVAAVAAADEGVPRQQQKPLRAEESDGEGDYL